VELSGGHAAPLLSLAFVLVADAQRAGEPVAWIQGTDSTFFPPDVARNGVDLNTLTVVRLDSIPARVRAAVRLLRSGAFGLVGMDLSPAPAPPLPALPAPEPTQDSPHGNIRLGEPDARMKERAGRETELQHETGQDPARLLFSHRQALDERSSDNRFSPQPIARGPSSEPIFNSPASNAPISNPGMLRASPGIPPALLGKLGQLAQQHNIAVCCLTVKRPDWASLGSLVSLRGEAVRQRIGEDQFTCTVRVLKDKRNGPGWIHEEAMHGTPGLS
jgi:hypothetical protein